MLRNIYRFTSTKNFFNARAPGQIATLLILIMVVVLIFILSTVNMGNVSLQTIALTNAADAAGLSLASQMGTRAQQLLDAMGYVEHCERVDILDTIFAVVFAIVAIIFTAGAAAPFVWAAANPLLAIGVGALGGAAGGALGGAIGGEDVGKSALGGAMVGMAVGAAFVAAGNIQNMMVNAQSFGEGATVSGTDVYTGETVTGVAQFGGQTGAEAVLVTTAEGVSTAVVNQVALASVAPTLAAGLGIGAVALGAGSSIYNAVEEAKQVKENYKDLAEALSGLSEPDRFRESAFLTAWSQTVNDFRVTSYNDIVDCDGDGTRDVGDVFDTDQDGDLSEEIPCFQYWFFRRTMDQRINLSNLRAVVDTFFNVTLPPFITYAEGLYNGGGALDRAAYNWSGSTGHSDGLLATWARTLEEQNIFLYPGNVNINIPFWRPGSVLGLGDICRDHLGNPRECTRAEGYSDDMDWAVKSLWGQITMARELRAAAGIDQLTNTWESWIDLFDDGDDATYSDFHGRLYQINYVGDDSLLATDPDFRSLQVWSSNHPTIQGDIAAARLSVPNCIVGSCANPAHQICNPSCRLPVTGIDIPGSIDYDQADEFTPARDAVSGIMTRLDQFRAALRQFRNDLQTASTATASPTVRGGKNPGTYRWTDNRGTHSITVYANFVIPIVDQYDKNDSWHGRDVCVGIVPQSHTPTFTITRQDSDTNRAVGILGNWNPFRGRIVRTCRAQWYLDGGRYRVDLRQTR